jgi:hypothetical protein
MLTEKTAKLIVRKKTKFTHFEAKDGEKKTKLLVYVGEEGPGDSWEDCTCFLEIVNDELVIYPNDKHMQDYLEDFNFTKLIDNLINDKNNGQEIHEHPNCKQFFLTSQKENTSVKDINDMSEEDDETEEDDSTTMTITTESTDEVEEVKEIIIGDFKPKRKFLNFVSSVNGAKVRFIRDIAFIKGEKLSGLLDGVIFKVTICDEGTIKFEEEVEDGKEPVSNPEMIKRLIGDIDDIDVTGYANKFVVSGLPFADIDGKLCYLEVEHKKPIDVLASIFAEKDKEEENMNLSEKGLSVLDQLFADEEKTDKVNSILDKLFSDDEDSLDQVMNSDLEDITELEVVEEPKVESYMEESFRKMNEQKVKELNSRIEEKQKDIFKLKSEIKQAETKVTESSDQLGILETRLETMTPGDKPNGYVFFVSEEQKLETGLDETTRNIADKIADIMKLKKDVLFDYLTGSFYNIKIAKKDDITKELELNKEFQKLFNEKIKTIDVEGSFSVQAEKDVIEYRGKLNWHQLVSKFIRNGFEQDVEFDKLSGSNSYETKTEEVETPTDVTDSDFDEVKTETKTQSDDYKVLESYNTPTDFVIVGVDYDGRDIEITDDYYRADVYLNGKPFQLSSWGCGFETEGHVSIMTINRYKKWVKEFDAMNEGHGVEAVLVTGFTGDVTVGCKTEDGEFSTDFDFGDYILHQVDGGEEVIINLIDKSGDVSIHQIENHDLNKIVPYVRDMKLKEILGEK